jgi:hypothetical protein
MKISDQRDGDEAAGSEQASGELFQRGIALYAQLKSQLEPAYNNQFVAIHVDTADYALGSTSGAATRAIRQRYAWDGRLIVMKIGMEPELGLAARVLASELIAVQRIAYWVSGTY